MNENETKNLPNEDSQANSNPNEKDYLDAINKLKENSVSKEEYDRAVLENKKLIKAITDGNSLDNKEDTSEKIDVAKISELILHGELNNLEIAKNALKLREQFKKEKGVDIFAPNWREEEVTENDLKAAEELAEYYQACVDASEDDPKRFQAIFESGLEEPKISFMKSSRR